MKVYILTRSSYDYEGDYYEEIIDVYKHKEVAENNRTRLYMGCGFGTYTVREREVCEQTLGEVNGELGEVQGEAQGDVLEGDSGVPKVPAEKGGEQRERDSGT